MSDNKIGLDSSWGIDKVTVRVEMEYVNTQFKDHYFEEENGINVVNENKYYYINFHDCLFCDGDISIYDVIYKNIQQLYTDPYVPLLNAEPTHEFLHTKCKLSEFEVYFDFFNYSPILSFSTPPWRRYKKFNTCYTDDYKKYYRSNGKLKDRQRSLICFYDRGLKLFDIPNKLWRFEYRLTRKYIKRLNLMDLNCPWSYLYQNKIFPLLVKYTDKVMGIYNQNFNFDCLYLKGNMLNQIFWKSRKFGYLFNIHYQAHTCKRGELSKKYFVDYEGIEKFLEGSVLINSKHK